jgi:alpha-ketoglutarate-dependent taurine dioxygenase
VRIFDEPFDHPKWLKRHEDSRLVYTFNVEKAGNASHWHIGGTWRNPPFNIESLTYEVVPEVGGHTLWADLQAAYDDLSDPVKQLLESVSAVYSAYPGDGTYNRPPVTETIEQPVVRTHRHSGRKGLVISSSALGLSGVTDAESKALLPFLLAQASSPNYTIGFGWKPGDFVIWDNQATWHYVVNDYDGPRVYRKVIGG